MSSVKGPDFLIIGAAKSGTNTLHKILSRSNEIFFTDPKEPDYFRKNYSKGIGWYSELFSKAFCGQVKGEKTVSYSSYYDSSVVAERISESFPRAKIVFCVRNPMTRIVSYWRMMRRYDESLQDINVILTSDKFKSTVVDSCRYMEILKSYLVFFDVKQIKVILLDDLENDQKQVIEDLSGFLGVSTPAVNFNRSHASNVSDTSSIPTPKPELTEESKLWIKSYLGEDVTELFDFLGRDKSIWL